MKQLEISKLSKEDLTDKLLDYKKQLSDLRMNHAISPLENPLQIKIVRRVIARIYTALKNKEA
tara:strand:+ start:525 stop:713 length:189 start_codon:yes stop_codon:yes gene_type:complete